MAATPKRLSEALSLRRLGLLLRRDFSGGYRGVLIAMAAVGGVILLNRVVAAFLRGPQPAQSAYLPLLFIGGFIVTSLTFRELHLNGQSVFYLTLPGSPLEKFLSKLLVTSLGYAVGSLLFYTAAVAAAEGLNRLIFGHGNPFFNPFAPTILLGVAVYLVTQSVFLVGSAYFRRLAFIKTALYLVLFAIVLAAIAGVAVWLIFRSYAVGGTIALQPYLEELGRSGHLEQALAPLGTGFCWAARLLFWVVLAPVGWVISYFRLRETEV